MSAMLTREGLEISSTEPLTMQYQWSLAGYPDVYGDYVAVDLVDCLDPFWCAYANPRVYSFDVINRRVYDLSGSAGGAPAFQWRSLCCMGAGWGDCLQHG